MCKVNFKNDVNDRKVILYLNDCCCGKKYCKENAACLVQSHLKKACLKDFATDISIEYVFLKLLKISHVVHLYLDICLGPSSSISFCSSCTGVDHDHNI